MDLEEVKGRLKFSEELAKLKHINRTGWVLRNVQSPERIAVSPYSRFSDHVTINKPQGHMYRMAVMAMTLKPIENCDINKVIRLCLVHDLPECR